QHRIILPGATTLTRLISDYRFLQRWLHRLPAGQGSPLPEYCASSLFITLINIFYMNTCHCRQ
ncbi:hypothetical protein, partial [Klebsiella pneumoniae]|uniref:hypothetical protein n=1 Tax=Klebsiella pneumoniae TaxID=573 RepID=UPI002234CFF6